MPHPNFSATQIGTSLTLLSGYRHSPEAITSGFESGAFRNHDLVMTSMGNRRRAIITPMYHALPFEHSLADRIEWAGHYKRPLVEAVVAFNRDRRAASVLIRLCLLPMVDEPGVLETAWAFPLGEAADKITNFEDVVDEVAVHCIDGQPIAGRSGLVLDTRERQETSNWAISTTIEPPEAALIVHRAISEELAFKI